VEVVASLSQGRTAAAQYGLFTYKSVPVIFEPPCKLLYLTKCYIFFNSAQMLRESRLLRWKFRRFTITTNTIL